MRFLHHSYNLYPNFGCPIGQGRGLVPPSDWFSMVACVKVLRYTFSSPQVLYPVPHKPSNTSLILKFPGSLILGPVMSRVMPMFSPIY